MSIVYVLVEPSAKRDGRTVDLTQLARYGELRNVVRTIDNPLRLRSPEQTLARIREVLAEFNPETDYLTHVGGDGLGLFLTGAVIADMSAYYKWTRFRWLRFDRKYDTTLKRYTNDGGTYQPVWVELGEVAVEDATS